MTVQIGGVDISSTLRNRGAGYTFHPQTQRATPGNTLYNFGEQWAEWTWHIVQQAEWDFLRTRYAAAPTAFILWDDDNNETSFTSGVMLRPTYDHISGGLYYDVRVEFRNLLPIES